MRAGELLDGIDLVRHYGQPTRDLGRTCHNDAATTAPMASGEKGIEVTEGSPVRRRAGIKRSFTNRPGNGPMSDCGDVEILNCCLDLPDGMYLLCLLKYVIEGQKIAPQCVMERLKNKKMMSWIQFCKEAEGFG